MTYFIIAGILFTALIATFLYKEWRYAKQKEKEGNEQIRKYEEKWGSVGHYLEINIDGKLYCSDVLKLKVYYMGEFGTYPINSYEQCASLINNNRPIKAGNDIFVRPSQGMCRIVEVKLNVQKT
jgi:hypothetical protein